MKTPSCLLPLVAALLPLAAAAQTGPGITMYGLIDAAVRSASNVAANRDGQTSMQDGIFTGARLGLRGREDLGGGAYVRFVLEHGLDASTGLPLQATTTADYGQEVGNPRFWGRDSHIAIGNAWGSLALGRQYTVAHTLAARFQPQGNPNSAAHSLFSSHHIARQDNLLRADTKVGPVDLSLSHTFGEREGSAGTNASWALGAGISGNGWAAAAYVQQMGNRAGSERREIMGLGGNWQINKAVHLYGGLMQRSSAVSPQKNLAWTLGANLPLTAQSTLSVAHYDDKQTGSAALQGSRRVSWVTVNYQFSKRSDVYAVIDNNRVTGGYARPAFMGTLGTQTGFGGGLRHRF
jgi:predicted porin